MTISGGSTLYMNGGIIAPSSSVIFSGGSSGNGMQGGISVKSLTISGGSMNAVVDTNEGSLSVYAANPKLVQ